MGEATRSQNYEASKYLRDGVFEMNARLMDGYMAYTTAEEYGADALGEAPATPSSPACVTISIASFALSANTVTSHC
jgi:hypothetical protein